MVPPSGSTAVLAEQVAQPSRARAVQATAFRQLITLNLELHRHRVGLLAVLKRVMPGNAC